MRELLQQLPEPLQRRLDCLLQEHEKQIEDQKQEIGRLQLLNKLLKDQLRLMRIKKFGPSSEKLSDEQLELLEQESSVTDQEVQREAELAQKNLGAVKTRRNARHPGRNGFPPHLPRHEVIIACAPEDCVCPNCQKDKTVVGYEISEELEVVPAKYSVRVNKREKRACLDCAELGVVTAACPEKIVSKGKLSNEVIVDTLIKKYDEHTPLYRQCEIMWRDSGLDMSISTLDGAVMAVGMLLQPVKELMRQDLLYGGYIQADETPVGCQSRNKTGRNHRAYVWEYSRPNGPVVFDFQMSRGRSGPEEFLRGFKGCLQTDAYAAYNGVGKELEHAGCWSHVRRKFYEAHQVSPKDPMAMEVLELIGRLYQVEREAREKQMDFDGRLELRRQRSVCVVQRLKERILQIRTETLPAGGLGKACEYTLGQWPRLEVYLRDGQIEADNNWCENGIRPWALGRKNWLHIGSEQAGKRIAAIVSVMETCRRLDINVREYFMEVLPRLPEWPINRVSELTPIAWLESKRKKSTPSC